MWIRSCVLVLALVGCGRDPAETGDPAPGPVDETTGTDPTVVDPGPDGDADGSPDALDCAPDDPEVYPGAPDRCGDDRVTDCDRTADEQLVTIVDDDRSYTSLQAALDDAPSGATVLVCPGTYSGAFEAQDPVVLVSHAGAEVTALDGFGAGTTLTVPGGSSVTGFEIRGGRTNGSGGGLLVTGPGDTTLADSHVHHNTAYRGGGIGVAPDGRLVVSNTLVDWNDTIAGGGDGGGVLADRGSTVDLGDSVVRDNRAGRGGGVYLADGNVIGGEVTANVALEVRSDAAAGGGVYASGDSTVVGTVISENLALNGGGFAAVGGTVVLTDVVVRDHLAGGDPAGGGLLGVGGGGYVSNADLVLAGTTEITANAAFEGAGVYVEWGTMTGGRIVGNTAEVEGGGVRAVGATVIDVAIEGNSALLGGGLSTITSVMVGGSLVGNTASFGGGAYGGLYTTYEGVVVTDNVAESGGGLFVAGDTEVLESTILRNTATEYGGGGVGGDSSATISSVGSDFGSRGDDNVPEDVLFRDVVPLADQGADATFVYP